MREFKIKVEQKARHAATIEKINNKIKQEMATWVSHLMNEGLNRSYAEGFLEGKGAGKKEAGAAGAEGSGAPPLTPGGSEEAADTFPAQEEPQREPEVQEVALRGPGGS